MILVQSVDSVCTAFDVFASFGVHEVSGLGVVNVWPIDSMSSWNFLGCRDPEDARVHLRSTQRMLLAANFRSRMGSSPPHLS